MRIILTLLLLTLPQYVSGATSVTKDSITIGFNADLTVGTYVNGSYYVVCPSGCSITAITPTPSGTYGTMLNPLPGANQGYNSSAPDYVSGLNVGLSLPISLTSGDIIVSTTPWTYTTEFQTFVDEAMILTVVPSAPPANSFRPGYCDVSVSGWAESDLDYSILANLTTTGTPPSFATIADYFARPWIDHKGGWPGRQVHPHNNMQDYGADIAEDVSLGALLLNTGVPDATKRDLLVGMVQLGIDLYSIVKQGGSWGNDGGHASGRKFPILLAGFVLDDADMRDVTVKSGDYLYTGAYGVPPSDYIHFGEDDQTFHVSQNDVDCTGGITCTWNPQSPEAGGTSQAYTSSMIGMAEWGKRRSTNPEQSDASWLSTYRRNLNSNRWAGFVLSAWAMEVKDDWNHSALFDYIDRYMSIADDGVDPDGYTVNDQVAGVRGNEWVVAMWDTYRPDYPLEPIADATMTCEGSFDANY